jgi:hypothetical protein
MLSRQSPLFKPHPSLLHPSSRPSQLRSFHASRAHHGPLIDASYWAFQNVHSLTGLSWADSIPLTAALLRIGFAPVQYFALRITKKTQSFVPLQTARNKVIARQAEAQVRNGTLQVHDAKRWELEEYERRQKLQQESYKILPTWIPTVASLAFLPIWFTSSGVVQAMSGLPGKRNILSMFCDPTSFPPPETALDTEGLLHLPTLSAADPTYVLPALVSILLFASYKQAFPSSEIQRRWQRVRLIAHPRTRVAQGTVLSLLELMKIQCVFLFVFLTSAPAAMCLFMFGSVATQLVLGPTVKMLAGVSKRSTGPLVPQLPRLKSKFRSTMHQLDIYRPPPK